MEQRSVAEADLGGAELILLNTHLDAGASDTERLHSIAQLKFISQSYGQRPVLLCGDLITRPKELPYAALAEDFVDAWQLWESRMVILFPVRRPILKQIIFSWC